ncbi:hypothetical protein ABWK22_02860 [Gottfriedia acidiceleris]|uniref:hypothetical protein n=1 Tax=Gottfriedia acidiceleris TaxID=371036 RepID=UPI00339459B0
MKAYEVTYQLGNRREIVLVKEESQVEQALSDKVDDYTIGSKFSKIDTQREIPLSQVKIKDLSVTEFIKIKNMKL